MAFKAKGIGYAGNGFCIRFGQGELAEQVDEREEGIAALLRQRRMGGKAAHGDTGSAFIDGFCSAAKFAPLHIGFHDGQDPRERKRDDRNGFTRNNVGTFACLDGDGGRVGKLVVRAKAVLLGIHKRVLRIRREGHSGDFRVFAVIFKAFHAAFFITTQDEAHAAFHRQPACLYGSHGVKRGDCRPFIVQRATAIDFIVVKLPAEGRVAPPRTCGHYVQMAKDADKFFACAELGGAGIACKILCCKAQFDGKPKRAIQ